MLGVGTRLTAHRQLSMIQNRLGDTFERLSTGKRINHGKDDPAGLIAAERLRGDLVEIGAERRSRQGERHQISIQQSGRQVARDVLNDLRGLVVKATGDTASPDQQEAIQIQIDSSLDALRLIESTTGISVGSELSAIGSGGEASVLEGDTALASELIDSERSALTNASVEAGVYEKYTLDVDERLSQDREVATATLLSQIEDADFAEEASNLVRDQILYKATLKAFAVAEKSQSESLLSLLDATDKK